MIENKHLQFMEIALNEARIGLEEGGIPIGSALVINGEVVGRGHNRRVQSGNPILHGEMDCLQNAGRLSVNDYQASTIYTTLSPCSMCTGTILLYQIPKVVIAENENFMGEETLLRDNGVELIQLNMPKAIALMRKFITEQPSLWYEDICVEKEPS